MSRHYSDPNLHHSSTISNSLQIIEVVAALRVMTAREIAGALHLPPATTYRLLNTLVTEEYLARTPDLHRFELGPRLNDLIAAAGPPRLCTAARNQLDDLRARLRFAVHVVVFNDVSLRVLDADPDHPVRAEHELARNLHASAAGRLFLANQTSWQKTLPPAPLRRITPTTITDLATLDVELQTVRQQEYAVQTDQLEAELACLAVPIRDTNGTTAGALCLAGPSGRSEALLSHIDTLRHCARAIAPLLF